MKKAIYLNVAFVVIGFSFLLASCRKSKNDLPEVSDSIYGTYVDVNKDNQVGDWTDIFSGSIIKVKPLNGQYITISVSGVMATYPTVLDSVLLGASGKLSINRYIPNPNSSTGVTHIIGTGSIGSKRLSMNFEIIYQENPLLHAIYKYPNAGKTSDKYD